MRPGVGGEAETEVKVERLGEVFVVMPPDAPEPEIEVVVEEVAPEQVPPPVPMIIPAWSLEDPLYVREDLWKLW